MMTLLATEYSSYKLIIYIVSNRLEKWQQLIKNSDTICILEHNASFKTPIVTFNEKFPLNKPNTLKDNIK